VLTSTEGLALLKTKKIKKSQEIEQRKKDREKKNMKGKETKKKGKRKLLWKEKRLATKNTEKH